MRTVEEVQDLIDDLDGQIGELRDEIDGQIGELRDEIEEIERSYINEDDDMQDIIDDDNAQRADDMNRELGAHRGSY